MKNLYTKSKGKIHPSPAPSSASGSGGGGGGGGGDALSVLKLLPAAIFALSAVLTFEDKEVVAYLMIRSINGSGPAADAVEERRRCQRAAGVHHRPLFDCGCFDCYTCFWSRWDCSKDRETIHMVVDAFEEHLASKERQGKGKEVKRRKKKGKEEKREKEAAAVKEMENDEKMVEISAAAEENKGFEEGAVIVSEGCFAEEIGEAATARDDEVDEEGELVELPAVSGGERRRGWADVMGIFNSRLWSLWSPECE